MSKRMNGEYFLDMLPPFLSTIKDEKPMGLVPNKKKPVCTGFFEKFMLWAVEIERYDWIFLIDRIRDYKLHPAITIL